MSTDNEKPDISAECEDKNVFELMEEAYSVVELLLGHTRYAHHDEMIAVNIKVHDCFFDESDVKDIIVSKLKEDNIFLKWGDYYSMLKEIQPMFTGEGYWFYLDYKCSDFIDFLKDEYELNEKNVYTFGRSGGWLSLDKADEIKGFADLYKILVSNKAQIVSDTLLGDISEWESDLEVMDCYIAESLSHWKNLLEAIECVTQAKSNLKDSIYDDIKYRAGEYISDNIEYELPRYKKAV